VGFECLVASGAPVGPQRGPLVLVLILLAALVPPPRAD
jgi:hypothetical protein